MSLILRTQIFVPSQPIEPFTWQAALPYLDFLLWLEIYLLPLNFLKKSSSLRITLSFLEANSPAFGNSIRNGLAAK